MKNDSNKKFLIHSILFNNRLNWYDYYLRYAIAHGYILTSFIDYLENTEYEDKKVMILRHDVDWSVKNARLMSAIEKTHNVKAAYYFRWATFDKQFIHELADAGFEVGFHYETLGAYCAENDIHVVNKEVIIVCKEKLKMEIQRFNYKAGLRIKTVCAHGLAKNKELRVSNNVLLENENYTNFGIKCAAYDRGFYSKVDIHIMDKDILNNYGFAYENNPIESIKDGKKLIVFLSHPVHWKLSLSQRMKRMIKLMLGKYTTNTKRVFERIDVAGLQDNICRICS